MAKFAKVLIMLVRVVSLVLIVFGILIWSGNSPQLLGAHIGMGFLVAVLIGLLAVLALARRAWPLGILGLVAAAALPWVGLKQFPLAFRHFGAMQIAHVLIVIAALGLAESSYAAIKKSAQ